MPQFSDRGGSAPDRRNLLGAAGGYGLSFSLSPSPFGLPPPLAPFWVLPLPPLDFGLRNGQHTAESGIKRRLGLEHRRIPRCPWGLQGRLSLYMPYRSVRGFMFSQRTEPNSCSIP